MAGSKSNLEAAELIAASGRSYAEIAAYLTRELGREVKHYQVGRMKTGPRQVVSDEMDALRRLAAQPADSPEFSPRLTPSGEAVPLYGTKGGTGGLRLAEEYRVGIAPIHPAQRGSLSAFAFIQPDDKFGDRLRRGDIGYAIRNQAPVAGEACLIEPKTGDAFAREYLREDDNTLFVAELSPKRAEVKIPRREIAALYVVVGATFGRR